jgi:hypothetical protein
MALVRDLLAFLALMLAIAAALPALLVLRPMFVGLGKSFIQAGPLGPDSVKAAAQLCSGDSTAVLWLILAALLLGDFAILRLWRCVERL